MGQATLNGILDADGGIPCTVYFEWGSDTSYGVETPRLGGYYAGTGFSTTVYGLAEGVTYHYRSVAINGNNKVYGNDVSFTTPGPSFLMSLGGADLILRRK
jgi:hypothetical protein